MRPGTVRLRLEGLEIRANPTAESEPNDTSGQATTFVAPNDTLTGAIGSGTDVDFWRINLTQGDLLAIDLNETNPDRLQLGPAAELINPDGQIIARSLDGRDIKFVAAKSGTYQLRLFAGQVFGNFVSTYAVTTAITSFSGLTESEPNDSIATANAAGPVIDFRGTVADSVDADFYSFNGTIGSTVTIKLASRPVSNPTVRLFDPNDVLIASGFSGFGLNAVLPMTGTYRFSIQGDNTSGAVTGQYVGTISEVVSTLETEPGNGFANPTPWNVSTTPTSMSGTLSSLTDVDVYSVTISTAGTAAFQFISPVSPIYSDQGRELTIFNEYGQRLNYSNSQGVGAFMWTPRLYIAVRATNEIGLGAYSLQGSFNAWGTQRDVPLYFFDFTGQTTHLGEGPAGPYATTARNQAIGFFESLYDIYDVDVTQTAPLPAVEHVGIGVGEFGVQPVPGMGSGGLGVRSVSGDSWFDTAGTAGTSLFAFGPPATIPQVLGQASTLTTARHPLSFLANDRQGSVIPVGSSYPFQSTNQRIPTTGQINQRAYLDWILQAGRFVQEAEPNNAVANAQNLDAFLAEMTADASPRNDRVVVTGKIDTSTDVDVYTITAAAGETFTFDIDSAEFQYPLDATISIFNAGGTLLASNNEAFDGESGLFSVDPYLRHQFTAAGTYTIAIRSQGGTTGEYRFKATADQAFDVEGPRVLATAPNGGGSTDGTKQIIVWFNDQLDPATLTSTNVVVSGAVSGTRSGTVTFDPIDGTLIWVGNTQLPADSYTVTLRGNSTGIRDLHGNLIDGDTDGSFGWPERSGDGTNGGDFTFSFNVSATDSTAAAVSSSLYREHQSNRGLFELTFDDTLDFQSLYTSGLTLRGAGTDGNFNTPDDTLAPLDLYAAKINSTAPTPVTPVYAYSRGIPNAGAYRVEGTFNDAAGNTVNLSRNFTVGAATQNYGPVVADVNIQPNSVVSFALNINRVDVTFGSNVNTSSLTTTSFRLRYSPDPTFFDSNDTFVSDADGAIAWDAVNRRATFQAASNLTTGFYLIELEGDTGGITGTNGLLLDGEFLDSNIQGSNQPWFWRDAPSGDGIAGGDYSASFQIADLANNQNDAPVLDPSGNMALDPVAEEDINNNGTRIIDLIASAGGDRIMDLDAGALEGIAVIAADTTQGTWQISVDGGSVWNAIGAVSPTSSRLFAADSNTRIRFRPATDFVGTIADAITFRAWDRSGPQGNGTATNTTVVGGRTPFSAATETASVTVTQVNDAPSFTVGDNIRIMDPTPPAQTFPNWATNIVAGPANESAQTVTFEIVSNDNPSLFTIAPAVDSNGTLTFTPATGVNGYATITIRAKDNGGTAGGGQDTSATQSFWIGVNPINQAPIFTKGTDQSLLEDAGPQDVPNWATGISAGSAFESDQQLTFEVVGNSNAGLFATLPSIDASGRLTYQTAANASGSATIDIRLVDDGGTLFGGNDTSATQSFTIAVTPVNDRPTFTVGANQTVLEDSGLQTVNGWATAISPGAADETGQNVTFEITNNTAPGLFAVAPAVAPDGTLTFTPLLNAVGSATISIRAVDDGGTDNGGNNLGVTQSFVITMTAVNDAPSFVKGADQSVIEDSGSHSISGWASAISAGPTNENGQSLTFEVSTDNDGLFSVLPTVSANGTLSFTTAPDAFGTANVTVRLKDGGGIADGGDDTSDDQFFTIEIRPVNEQPSFVAGGNQVVNEDAGLQTVNPWATSLVKGPANESSQTLSFIVTGNTNPGLFAAGPTVDSNGTLTYQSALNAYGTATISIRVTDDGGTSDGGVDQSSDQTFTITVLPVNDAPTATTDNVTVIVGKPLRIPILSNDFDVDGNPIKLVSMTLPSTGAVRRDGNAVIYTTRLTTAGADSFNYTISDGLGGTTTGTVSINVIDNVAPTIKSVKLHNGPKVYAEALSMPRAVLPWEQITAVSVTFSEGVTVQASALTLTNIKDGAVVPTSFSYNSATRTATWTPLVALGNGRFSIRLTAADVVDGSGNLMKSNWVRAFGLLTGDFDGNGLVDDRDLAGIRSRFTKPGVAYNAYADIDGNGIVNQADLTLATNNKNRRLS
jgi:hypothetical protein